MNPNPHDEPLNVANEDGAVLVEGGPGVVFALTAQAAADTSDEMLKHAIQAKGHGTMQKIKKASEPR